LNAVSGPRPVAHAFEQNEIAAVGLAEQPVVVEGLGRAQHDVAVDVVLEMIEGLVAHPHRAHAAVAGSHRR
jgi:hypothetical protein